MEIESTLLAQAQAGDRDAFDRLAERHRASLQRLCFKMTGSREDAEDLVQEALLRAYLSIKRFEGRSSLATWLHRIATNLSLDHQKRRPPWKEERRWQWFEENRELVLQIEQSVYLSPEAGLDVKEVAATCLNCLTMTLPAKQRAALILCDQLGFKRDEAAAMLGCSVASVKTELHRARNRMTEIYEHRCALVDEKNECNACTVAGIARRQQRHELKEMHYERSRR